MLSGTEADIINAVARLRKATKDQIRREVGFSSDYIEFLCRYLVRKGYLNFSNKHYSIGEVGIKTLLTEETPEIDRGLIKEITAEVAGEISNELKETKMTVARIGQKVEWMPEEKTKIKTDFELPVEDESLVLESNINKIGPNLEKERSDIDESVRLFKKIQKIFKKIQRGGRT
ncbi:MAG: hypothetical protein AB1638_11710 [Nitrospirota bacterium]